MAVEKVRVVTELLDGNDNVVSTRTVTGEYQESTYAHTESVDFDFTPAQRRNPPVLLPKNPPKGL
tara:strand:- start:352 stop:546 length:195 start_codon:yes stop_codon:yes gene_type:complete